MKVRGDGNEKLEMLCSTVPRVQTMPRSDVSFMKSQGNMARPHNIEPAILKDLVQAFGTAYETISKEIC